MGPWPAPSRTRAARLDLVVPITPSRVSRGVRVAGKRAGVHLGGPWARASQRERATSWRATCPLPVLPGRRSARTNGRVQRERALARGEVQANERPRGEE